MHADPHEHDNEQSACGQDAKAANQSLQTQAREDHWQASTGAAGGSRPPRGSARRRPGRRRAPALAAAFLAVASMTACSLSADNQPIPTASTTHETDTHSPDPTEETSEPTDSPTQTSNAPDAAHLCGGLLTEELFEDELSSFTPSQNKFEYTNHPPSDDSAGGLVCILDGEVEGTGTLYVIYSPPQSLQNFVETAESNASGRWQPLAIDGQEGKGWVSYYNSAAIWVYPDGPVLYLRILGQRDLPGESDITADNLTTVMEHLVATVPEHNKTAGNIRESHHGD